MFVKSGKGVVIIGLAVCAVVLVALGFAAQINTVAPTTPAHAQPPTPVVVDHDDAGLFEQIPQEYIDTAAATTLVFTDRSVGANLDDGLGCLATPYTSAPSRCRIGSPETWSGIYPRTNWTYRVCTSQDCTLTIQAAMQAGVFGYFTSYLEANQNTPPRIDRLTSYTGTGQVVLFTSSLSRAEVENTRRFNEYVRAQAAATGLPLLDVADILSHDLDGNPCYDNRDGVLYCRPNSTVCENYPDDGIDTPAICAQYTTELDGGHLGSMATGKIRVAKAVWVLMAQLAGWQPTSTPEPTLTPTTTITPTLTPTITITPTLTATPILQARPYLPLILVSQ